MNLYLIVEGETDAKVLRTVLNCADFDKVFQYVSQGYNNMASICRTLRLMVGQEDKILIAFDTDTEDEETIQNQYSTLSFLSRADVSSVKIGIFPMKPCLETALNIPRGLYGKDLSPQFVSYLRVNLNRIQTQQLIQDMQNFLNDKG